MTGAGTGGQHSARKSTLGCPPWCVQTHDDVPFTVDLCGSAPTIVHLGPVQWGDLSDHVSFVAVMRVDLRGQPDNPQVFINAPGASASLDLASAQTLADVLAAADPSHKTRGFIAALRRAVSTGRAGG
ncbi:DUF6907 domain-containing protein [Nonomuraea sp. NPDC052265]|uniref:DUF6907 domain-containing protein n=1 Tax=Nonomuraea sp. NPDC052265 TaxID=3364374 RepID=UPI0037C64447